MPTYEYACTACAHEWEFEQSIRADPLKECPACHGQTARRQISRGTGFILKGSGWYSDLYASSSNKKADESKPADAKSSESKTSETKSETKTETKTETKSDAGSTKKSDSSAAAE